MFDMEFFLFNCYENADVDMVMWTATSIKNWSHYQFLSYVYTKLTEANRISNGIRF